MAEILIDLRLKQLKTPEDAKFRSKALPMRGLATRGGIACTIEIVYSPPANVFQSIGDGVSAVFTPPSGEWWFLRSIRVFTRDGVASAVGAEYDIALYRFNPHYIYEAPPSDQWYYFEQYNGLNPFQFPKDSARKVQGWEQITEAKHGVVDGPILEWKTQNDIWERHIYEGENILVRANITHLTSGNLQTVPHVAFQIVRYPTMQNMIEWFRRYYPKLRQRDIVEAMIASTPDADKE